MGISSFGALNSAQQSTPGELLPLSRAIRVFAHIELGYRA